MTVAHNIPRLMVAIITLMFVGCQDRGLEVAKVSGTVSWKGQPLTSGQVTFVPAHGPAAFGTIDADGTFVLTTHQPGDGALLGEHKVAILPATSGASLEAMTAGKAERPAKPQVNIPLHAQSPETSGITRQVQPGENTFAIELQP